MNKKVLNFVNKLEGYKTAIKQLHWDADNMSQHELCDDIAESIAEFQDTVSEVEQSITGKLKINSLKPTEYKIKDLKSFVEDVLDATNSFYKEVKDMGDTYVGMASDCESFLSDMQRKLYLVNFTLKEELKERLKKRINESMPKNLARHDEVDKFMGRKPKSIKARINQIYRIVKKYGIDSKVYHDENWQAISEYYQAITSLGCEVELKPCGDLSHADSMESDGGYCDYAEDGMPRSKQYAIKILFNDGMSIDGYIKCMAAGTVQDPFSRYDTCIVLWPKNNRVLEFKNMNGEFKLTEEEVKGLVKEAAMKVLSETPLNYDVDNFSGRWTKGEPDYSEYVDPEGYLDDPLDRTSIERELADDEWEWGKDKTMKDVENDYSWDRFDKKAVSPGLDPWYSVMKSGIPHEVDNAIAMRNKQGDWRDNELRHGRRMMDKWVNGQRDNEDLEDSWDDLQYMNRFEGKEPMKITEAELKDIVKKAAMRVLEKIEIDPKNKGKFTATKKATGKSTEELTHSKNPLTRKRAIFAQNAKRWSKK